MTIDVSIEVLVGASLFMGGQIATLAGVVRSNISQGRRLGDLEQWKAKREAIAEYRTQRHIAPALGVPVNDEP